MLINFDCYIGSYRLNINSNLTIKINHEALFVMGADIPVIDNDDEKYIRVHA